MNTTPSREREKGKLLAARFTACVVLEVKMISEGEAALIKAAALRLTSWQSSSAAALSACPERPPAQAPLAERYPLTALTTRPGLSTLQALSK